MFRTSLPLVLVLSGFWSGVSLDAASSVWKISSGSSSIYLGGTFHLLRAEDFPLPPEFDAAYENSSVVVFETDLGRVQSPEFQQRMLSKCVLRGTTLAEVLSPAVYEKLDEHCRRLGLPLANLLQFKPSLVVTTLAVMELEKIGISQEGVDLHYYNKAKAGGKAMGQLETVDEQIDYICSMGDGDEDGFVTHALNDLEETGELLPDLLSAWRHGDLEKMAAGFVDELKRDYPRLYASLLVERNRRWLPVIRSYFDTPETEFVLVGSAHLAGEEGVLTALEKLGYTIEQIDAAVVR